jgi:MFS-type transporter involved in bile tolerance (Atg22 family)
MEASHPMVNDRKEIFGWAMYDWANSAFSTTVGTVFLGPYVASLASAAARGYPGRSRTPDEKAHHSLALARTGPPGHAPRAGQPRL